jgi:hypothetical protein
MIIKKKTLKCLQVITILCTPSFSDIEKSFNEKLLKFKIKQWIICF